LSLLVDALRLVGGYRLDEYIDNPELQTLVLIVFDKVGDDLQQQRLADSSRCYVSADILHLADELSGAVQIAVLQQHLGAEDDCHSLIPVLKHVKLADGEKRCVSFVSIVG